MKRKKTLISFLWGMVVIIKLGACGPSQAEIDVTATQVADNIFSTQTAEAPTATPKPTKTPPPSPITPTAAPQPGFEQVKIPPCIESETSDTQIFNELLWVVMQNLNEIDSYRYRTLYRYTMDDDYADDELSVEVEGAHSNRLNSPVQNFYYPMSSQSYERSHVTLTDLATQSRMETIITEQGYWMRQGGQWMAFDAATSADMLNLADMFSPQSMFSDGFQGGFLLGIEAGTPSNVQAETIADQEVIHRCWLLPDSGEEWSAIILHYEDFYTYFDIAEIHLWTAEDDTQLVRLVLMGNHVGERIGYNSDAVIHEPPPDFLMWMDISDLDHQIDITPPALDEVSLKIPSDSASTETVVASYNELPLPDDASSVGLFDEEWYSGVPREYSYPVWTGQYWMLRNYLGGGWDEIPVDRRPVYETKINLTEATAFFLDEMALRGWHLKDNYLIFGLPELYLFFEREGAVLPVILTSEASGGTRISAILPPPDNVVDAVLSGWVNFKTQNFSQYDDRITAIAFDALDKTWIGTLNGLKVFDGEVWTNYNADDLDLSVEGTDFEVTAMVVDQQGQVWVGTWEGLSVFDGQTWKTYTPENSELESNPSAITVDSEGKVWLGLGYSSSVSVFDGKTFTTYNVEDIGMPGGHAIDVIDTDQQDRIWIGTSGGGVYMFDGTSWNMVLDAKSQANTTNIMTSIEDLVIDHQGGVWVGSGQGLSVFDGETWTSYTAENSGLADDWVNSLGVDPNNNIWIITTGGRLNRLDTSGKWTDYTPVNPDIPIHSPETLAIDPQGRIWVGIDYGGVSIFAPPTPTSDVERVLPDSTPLPGVTSTPSPEDPLNVLGPPTWRDSFDTSTNWTLFDDDCFKSDIYDGKFWMNTKVAPSDICWEITSPKIQNFYLETTSNIVGDCAGGDRYGLYFRGPDSTQGYFFGLTCDGRYGMIRWDPEDEKWEFIVDFTTSDYINEGPNQTNRFGVMANGSLFDLYINGNWVAMAEDETYLEPGLIGYFIGAHETEGFQVSYDELVYWDEP